MKRLAGRPQLPASLWVDLWVDEVADDVGISTVFRPQLDEAELPRTTLALFQHSARQNSQSVSG
jgi:hypothetical protein